MGKKNVQLPPLLCRLDMELDSSSYDVPIYKSMPCLRYLEKIVVDSLSQLKSKVFCCFFSKIVINII
jgi:hypothetical protein